MTKHTYRIDILENKLRELTQTTKGMREAVIVSLEGFVVASHSPQEHQAMIGSGTSSPQVAAMAATMFALGEQTLLRLVQGDIERILLEGENGAMIVYPINHSAALATLIDKNAKVGLALLAVSRAADSINNILLGAAI